MSGKFTVASITSIATGGAGLAALRQHIGLLRHGIEAKLFVKHAPFDGPGVLPFAHPDVVCPALTRLWDAIFSRQRDAGMVASIPYPSYGSSFLESFSPSFDVIQLHWISGVLSFEAIAWLAARKPVVWTLHDENPYTGFCHYRGGCERHLEACADCPQALAPYQGLPGVMLGVKRTLASSDITVVAPSRWLAEQARRSQVFRHNRIEVIPNAVDTRIFAPMDPFRAKAALGIAPEEYVVLCGAVSLDDPRKGFTHLSTALRILEARGRRMTLVAFGKLSAPPNVNIKMLGSLPDEREVAAAYAAADATALPSLEDNLPNIMLESLACGTPLAAFGVGGISDCVVNGVTGYLAEPGNAESLADALDLTLSLGRDAVARRVCRQVAEKHYSLSIQAKAYTALYRDLLRPAHRTGVDFSPYAPMANDAMAALFPLLVNAEAEINPAEELEKKSMKIPPRKKYIVFGAGIAGEQVAEQMACSYFVDNSASRQGETHCGLPIKSPSVILEEKKGDFFVVVANYDHGEAIAAQLEEMGLRRDKNFADFRQCEFEALPMITRLRINVTRKCNSHCTVCNIWREGNPPELTPREMADILGDPFFRHVEDVYITGGEPTVLTDFPAYIAAVVDTLPKAANVSTVVNGLLPEKTVAVIAQCREICDNAGIGMFVSVSLDGLEADNDAQRGVPGGFRKAMETINGLRASGVPVTVSTTITKVNLGGMDRFLDFLIKENLQCFFKLGIQAAFFGNMEANAIFDYSDAEKFLMKRFFLRVADVYKDNEFARTVALNQFFMLEGKERLLSCSYLDREAATLTETGQLKYCCSKSKELGSVVGESAAAVYQGELEYLSFLGNTRCPDCNADAFSGQTPAMKKLLEAEAYWDNFYADREWLQYDADLSLVGDVYNDSRCGTLLLTGLFGTETEADGTTIREILNLCMERYAPGRIIIASSLPFVTRHVLSGGQCLAEVIPVHDARYLYACQYAPYVVVATRSGIVNPWVEVAEYFAGKRGTSVIRIDAERQQGEVE